MKKIISILLTFLVLLTSCTSRKKVAYFQATDAAKDVEQLDVQQKHISKLQVGDLLGIMVSSLSPEASAMFNPYSNTNSGSTQTSQSTNTILLPTPGYLVDEDGFIALPLIGKLKVAGLSTKEVTAQITEKLNQYLAQPTVYVRILNFKISVLGEVNRPSVYTIPNEKITLPEALSLAGDLTIFGKRNNILIIRDVEGKRDFARIDITKRDFLNSPYYYLKANDLVYVEPKKSKIVSSSLITQFAPLVISTLTLLIIILTSVPKL